MTPTENPVEVAKPAPPPVRKTIADAFRFVREHPREAMLPFLVVQVPVAFLTAAVTLFFYLTQFDESGVPTTEELFSGDHNGPLLLFLVLTAVDGLFGQVARGAGIVSIAATARGKPKSLSESLDPAFTRMGGLLLMVIIFAGAGFLGFLSIILIPVIPYLAIRVALSFEAYMLEELGPTQAIRRSWQLTYGKVLRMLAILLLAALMVAVPLILLSAVGATVSGGTTGALVFVAVFGVVQALFVVPLIAFLTATTTLFYLASRRYEDATRTA